MKTKVKVLLLVFITVLLMFIPVVNAKADKTKLVNGEEITKEEIDLEDVYRVKDNSDGTVDIVGVNKEYSDVYYEGQTVLELPNNIGGKDVKYVRFKLKSMGDFKKVILPEGTTQIAQTTFSDCTELEEVVIPDSVIIINENAFYRCTKLKTIKLPKNLQRIKEFAFAGCASLTSVEIPEKVAQIEFGTFQNCTGLKNVVLEGKVTDIQDSAFEGCRNLQEIDLKTSIEVIRPYSFRGCNNLSKVYIRNRKTAISNEAFSKTDKLTIYGYEVSTAQKYAKNNNIKFEILPGMPQVEKAGILMASFLTQCVEKYGGDPKVDKYGGYIQYGTTNRHLNVFYRKPEEGELAPLKTNSKGEVYRDAMNSLDCVGCVNLYVYQSTGLWSKNFTGYTESLKAPTDDNLYIGPKNQNSKLKATDLFEYILGTDNSNGVSYYTLEELAKNGTLKPGDLLTMKNHVAMYAGWNGDKMLIGENYKTRNAWSNFTSDDINWKSQNISIARIKEDAANEIEELFELEKREDIEAYGKALADAYFNGSTVYNGKRIERKVYTRVHRIVGEKKTSEIDFSESRVLVNGDYLIKKRLRNLQGRTVDEAKAALIAEKGFTRVDILDRNGNIVLDGNRLITTGMKARGFKLKEIAEVGETDKSIFSAELGAEGEEESVEEYEAIIYGDVTGKGNPGAIDSLAIVKNKLGTIPLEDEIFIEAGRVTKKSREEGLEPSAVDAQYIAASKLGKCEIEQGDFDDYEIEENDSKIIPIYTREDLENIGSGEEYISNTTHELYSMDTDSKYVLMNDIDLSDKEWTPIGIEEKNEDNEIIKTTVITNAFDGNGHKITGLRISKTEDSDNVGLFAICKATISNLTIENPEIISDANGYTVGVGCVVGKFVVDDSTSEIILNNVDIISNNSNAYAISCSNSGFQNRGGIIGYLKREGDINESKTYKVYNCSNNARICGNGGLIGAVDIGNPAEKANITFALTGCENNGELILDKSGTSGGLIGDIRVNNCVISNCRNNGELKTDAARNTDMGGIAGSISFDDLIINNSSNCGRIDIYKNNGNIGGIAGRIIGSDFGIYKTNNQGDIIGNKRVGGLFGIASAQENAIVANCTNTGNINASSYIGGIVGEFFCKRIVDKEEETMLVNGVITNCINTGNITVDYVRNKTAFSGGCFTGGIAGQTDGANIIGCKNIGERNVINVSFDDGYREACAIGGIVGRMYNAKTISNCNNGTEGVSNSTLCYFGEQVGGIVGNVINVELVKNCKNYQNLLAVSDYMSYKNYEYEYDCLVAGIVGFIRMKEVDSYFDKYRIENCENYGNIDAADLGAGIIGAMRDTSVKNCKNSGEVYTRRFNAAGIGCGAVNSIFEECENTGKVRCGDISANDAGIVYSSDGSVYSCTLYNAYIGGICSTEKNTYFINCSNSGELTCDVFVPFIAGIVPWVEDWEHIQGCTGGGNKIASHAYEKIGGYYNQETGEWEYVGWPNKVEWIDGEMNTYEAYRGDLVIGDCERAINTNRKYKYI